MRETFMDTIVTASGIRISIPLTDYHFKKTELLERKKELESELHEVKVELNKLSAPDHHELMLIKKGRSKYNVK